MNDIPHGARIRALRLAAPVLAAVLACAPALLSGAETSRPDRVDLTGWARQNLHEVSLTSADTFDLEPLRRIIGDARVVSFGEGLHGSAEPLQFRNRLFRFLVEEMEFSAIVLESGFIEGYIANDFVMGGSGNAVSSAARGITFGLGGYPQQAELLQWMRDFNADPAHPRKIGFYGMDVSGPPGKPGSAFDIALQYLEIVDGDSAARFGARIEPARRYLWINRGADDENHYAYLPQADRDSVTAAIADLVGEFETRELEFIEATDESRYALGYGAAIAARHADLYLRQYPVGWTPADGMDAAMRSLAVADRVKAENVEWVLDRQGPGGRILIFAHLGHVATTPVYITLPPDRRVAFPPMVGAYLAPRFGTDLVTIGHLLGADQTICRADVTPLLPGWIESQLAATGASAFVLDLRGAPVDVADALQAPHDLNGQRPVHTLSIGNGLDAVLFTPRATRALPCP